MVDICHKLGPAPPGPSTQQQSPGVAAAPAMEGEIAQDGRFMCVHVCNMLYVHI